MLFDLRHGTVPLPQTMDTARQQLRRLLVAAMRTDSDTARASYFRAVTVIVADLSECGVLTQQDAGVWLAEWSAEYAKAGGRNPPPCENDEIAAAIHDLAARLLLQPLPKAEVISFADAKRSRAITEEARGTIAGGGAEH